MVDPVPNTALTEGQRRIVRSAGSCASAAVSGGGRYWSSGRLSRRSRKGLVAIIGE